MKSSRAKVPEAAPTHEQTHTQYHPTKEWGSQKKVFKPRQNEQSCDAQQEYAPRENGHHRPKEWFELDEDDSEEPRMHRSEAHLPVLNIHEQ